MGLGGRDAEGAGTRGRGTAKRQDSGAQGHDKQTTPDFCAEFVKSQPLYTDK